MQASKPGSTATSEKGADSPAPMPDRKPASTASDARSEVNGNPVASPAAGPSDTVDRSTAADAPPSDAKATAAQETASPADNTSSPAAAPAQAAENAAAPSGGSAAASGTAPTADPAGKDASSLDEFERLLNIAMLAIKLDPTGQSPATKSALAMLESSAQRLSAEDRLAAIGLLTKYLVRAQQTGAPAAAEAIDPPGTAK